MATRVGSGKLTMASASSPRCGTDAPFSNRPTRAISMFDPVLPTGYSNYPIASVGWSNSASTRVRPSRTRRRRWIYFCHWCRGSANVLCDALVTLSARAEGSCPNQRREQGWRLDLWHRRTAQWPPQLDLRIGVCVSTGSDFAPGLVGTRYLTTEEAAAYLRFRSPSGVWNLARRGGVRPLQRGRTVLWTVEILDRMLRSPAGEPGVSEEGADAKNEISRRVATPIGRIPRPNLRDRSTDRPAADAQAEPAQGDAEGRDSRGRSASRDRQDRGDRARPKATDPYGLRAILARNTSPTNDVRPRQSAVHGSARPPRAA